LVGSKRKRRRRDEEQSSNWCFRSSNANQFQFRNQVLTVWNGNGKVVKDEFYIEEENGAGEGGSE
jgi:hypothetical protein